jgi:FAD/FMN-containing dehydrogenase
MESRAVIEPPASEFDAVPGSLAGDAVTPGDPAYDSLASTYFRRGAPGLVLLPRTIEQVADAVELAGRHPHVPLGIRSGGHGLSGHSTNDGGIVIDLRHLSAIEVVDTEARRVRVGPGARWRDVAATLQPHGWALTSGDSGAVGVGGLATSGGIGLLARSRGLTIDRLVAAQVVLADGSVVTADERENAELFWGVRGAGANLGVAVSFEFEADEVDRVGLALMTHVVEDVESFLVAYGEILSAAPRDTTAVLLAGAPAGAVIPVTTAVVADSSDPDTIVARAQPLVELAPLVQRQTVVTPYAGLMNLHTGEGALPQRDPVGRSGLVESITPELATELAALLRSSSVHLVQLRSLGGAVADVSSDVTAFAHRDAQFQLNALGFDARDVDSHWLRIRPFLSGIYLPFETDQSAARLVEVYPPATLERLRTLKHELDPGNVFRDNFGIVPPPAALAAARQA